MSRCFPFPPPGYERKHKPEDLDVVKEAKHKEKRHKKDKKDKEKRTDKEKHRDKRERKEKRREKKNKKDSDNDDLGKDKDKSSISEESTVAEKLDHNGHGKDRTNFVDQEKHSTPFQGQNGKNTFQSIPVPQGIEVSKLFQEFERRIKDDDKGRGSQLPEKNARVSGEEKGNNNEKGVDSRNTNEQEFLNEFGRNGILRNVPETAKSKVEGIPRPVEKHKERGDEKKGDKRDDRDKKKSHGKDRDEKKEKRKEEKKVRDKDKKNDRDKSTDVEKKDLKNDRDKSTDVGKKDLKTDRDKSTDVGRNPVGVTSSKSADLPKGVENGVANEGNVKKRKDIDTNGFLHESEIRPSKMSRPSPRQSTENGRKVESQNLVKFSSDKHPNSFRPDNSDLTVNGKIQSKKPMINGTIQINKPSPPETNHSPATMVRNQIAKIPKKPTIDSTSLNPTFELPRIEDLIAEASKRPAHPDSKYLNSVLNVPKPSDWSENVDNEWLFSKKNSSNNMKVDSVGVKEEPVVWSEALHIESADICALPYVIPY